MVKPKIDMLSVFITPCTKPTRCQAIIIFKVRSVTSLKKAI